MSHRTVLHADESFQTATTGKYLVVAIKENEPGYSVVSEWPTLEKAKEQADQYNANLALTSQELLDIRLSSLTAGPVRVSESDEPTKKKTQRVVFNVSIEVDVDMWDLAYGTGTSAREIRDDVRSHFLNVIREGEAGDGAIVDVTERH